MVMKKRKTIMITGGCGFIGHHLVDHILKNTEWDIIVIDKLSYASDGLEKLRDNKSINNKRVKVFPIDFTLPFSDGIKREIGENVNFIAHLGAESHVDNSIIEPRYFFKNNIDGTVELLEYAKTLKKLELFFYFSTDEVFGPAPKTVSYSEWDRHKPTNPYSASKSAAEGICIAYANTFSLPIMIVNNMNVFGERQHVEKFIPQTIKKILLGQTITIHADKMKKNPGSRFYIHAKNVCASLLFLMKKGKIGEKYNIVGEKEVNNLELAQLIANILKKKLKYELVDFHSSRPGHDLRYSLSDKHLKKLGWKQPDDFEKSLKSTVLWTCKNKRWIDL